MQKTKALFYLFNLIPFVLFLFLCFICLFLLFMFKNFTSIVFFLTGDIKSVNKDCGKKGNVIKAPVLHFIVRCVHFTRSYPVLGKLL